MLGGNKVKVAPRPAGSGLNKYNVAVFTASCDTPETNKKYAKALRLDYPILSDPKKTVARAFSVVNDKRPVPFRHTFYIGKDGKVLYIDKSVNAAAHGADVAKKLNELGIGER